MVDEWQKCVNPVRDNWVYTFFMPKKKRRIFNGTGETKQNGGRTVKKALLEDGLTNDCRHCTM